MVERVPDKNEVLGSIPSAPTFLFRELQNSYLTLTKGNPTLTIASHNSALIMHMPGIHQVYLLAVL